MPWNPSKHSTNQPTRDYFYHWNTISSHTNEQNRLPLKSSILFSFLLRRGTRPSEWGTNKTRTTPPEASIILEKYVYLNIAWWANINSRVLQVRLLMSMYVLKCVYVFTWGCVSIVSKLNNLHSQFFNKKLIFRNSTYAEIFYLFLEEHLTIKQ